ncbi:hypothetical protein [Paraburkholderia sp. MM5384-R2]|uniref:hypothetical protein n=1 Tax=unclassified Paraburkholderia TaxID=2615204 RepID=UPI00162236BA|nr:hypothetical protein [Paraburkholderia sp. MM5384-R2]MBB5501643.1 hypothetical protein [Paraburkholderia sp. MM5384-R2]
MSIRKHDKDHKRPHNPTEEDKPPVSIPMQRPEFGDPLQFWTLHSEPVFVDLHPFKDGQLEPRGYGLWNGMYRGRPELIYEVAPAFQALTEYLAPSSVALDLTTLRNWWRIFDQIESECVSSGVPVIRVKNLSDITEIHRNRAVESGMDVTQFRRFRRLLELARRMRELPKLHWAGMKDPIPQNYLPPPDGIRMIRIELKHSWFRLLWRWERTDNLLRVGGKSSSSENERLRRNYRRFRMAVNRNAQPRPRSEALYGNVNEKHFRKRGYSIEDMFLGFYPDGSDIRDAFHLCLAATGWNAAVLIQLDVDEDFIVQHPKDATRYIMYGKKRRGNSEQIYEGLYKSQSSAGMVIKALIERTAPLRTQLRKNLIALEGRYRTLQSSGANAQDLSDLKEKIEELKLGVRSPWLYANYRSPADMQWLSSNDYGRSPSGPGSYINVVIERVNRGCPPEKRIQRFVAGDLRDAFAEYAYRVSGGMLLYVMKALGQKTLKSTVRYVDNTFVNAETDKLYMIFSENLWDEIRQTEKVDPAILAIRSRDGSVTTSQRGRLDEYRKLSRSRIGMGCKDPHNPPRHIAPDFVPDGKSNCPVQRCTLCLENGVVFAESIDGLCMRFVELEYIKSHISVTAFLESSFGEEIENTEFALKHFDGREVELRLQQWRKRVNSGEHRVVDLDGV